MEGPIISAKYIVDNAGAPEALRRAILFITIVVIATVQANRIPNLFTCELGIKMKYTRPMIIPIKLKKYVVVL